LLELFHARDVHPIARIWSIEMACMGMPTLKFVVALGNVGAYRHAFQDWLCFKNIKQGMRSEGRHHLPA
jgi:hypothetical protein